MRRLLVLFGAVLCLTVVASAQESPAAVDANTSEEAPAAPASLQPSHRDDWQIGIGYQYQHYNFSGSTFHNNGLNTDITRYLNDYLGIEGTVAGGFDGHPPGDPNFDIKSLFLGGGPHIAVENNSRFEPWVHALVGWDHLRFTQTTTKNTMNAFGVMAGGGVDIKLGPRLALRVQGDYLGTRYNSVMQTNYSVGSGIVINF